MCHCWPYVSNMPRNVKGLPHTQYRTHGNYGIIIRNHAFQLEEETFSVRTVTLKRQHTTSTAYYTKFYLKIIILVRLCLNVSRHPKFTFLFCAQKTEIIYLVYVKKNPATSNCIPYKVGCLQNLCTQDMPIHLIQCFINIRVLAFFYCNISPIIFFTFSQQSNTRIFQKGKTKLKTNWMTSAHLNISRITEVNTTSLNQYLTEDIFSYTNSTF